MNIETITIEINNIGSSLNIIIDCQKEEININGQLKKINLDSIDDLLRIIRSWNNNYKSTGSIDKESYKIDILDKMNRHDIYTGNGDYPNNYYYFKEWIRGVLND